MENKTDKKRRKAAAELTSVLCNNASFSFVKIGDRELSWLLLLQSNQEAHYYSYYPQTGFTCEAVHGVAGLEICHYKRFIESLEKCSFLDLGNNVPFIRENLYKLKINRNPNLLTNDSPDTANIMFEWTFFEMKKYVADHRCLFASAEAALQRELLSDYRYRKIASSFWPDTERIWFHQIRDDGRYYSENLDLIKEDLREDILKNKIDTIFISLATGAKILCYELAKEMEIRAVDFGSMLRGLTNSGTPGYQTARAAHNPFFFRVPFDVYMDALEKAHPNLPFPCIISKAIAQLLLELQKRSFFVFNTAYGYTGGQVVLSGTNLSNFRDSLRSFRRRYLFRVKQDSELRELYKKFDFWCLKIGIGFRGKIFLLSVKIKGQFRRLGRRLRLGPLYMKFNQTFEHGLMVAYYRDIVRKRILDTPPVTSTTSNTCEIHVLTSSNDWLGMLWMLKSFYYFSGCDYSLCIHDDGTLTPQVILQLSIVFPNARIISRKEADRKLLDLLNRYPRCQNFRSTNVRALKVFDFVAYLKSEKMIILDTDILFFSKPARLIEATENQELRCNMLNRDWSYGYSIDLEKTKNLLNFNLEPFINSGLGLIHKTSMPFPWVEDFLSLPDIMSHSHRIEQTIIALCSCKFGFMMLAEEYNVYLGKLLPGAPSRHYTGPVRHLMYSEGMRVLTKNGFLKQILIRKK